MPKLYDECMHKNAKQNRKQENKVGLVSKNVILIKKLIAHLFLKLKSFLGLLKRLGRIWPMGFYGKGT